MQRKMTKREIGDIGEQAVAEALVNNGYKILCRNFTVRGGEIDIIAEKNDCIAFVEVKTRKHNPMVSGEEAITKAKKQHIITAAKAYLYKNNIEKLCRFDVAVAEINNSKITHIKYYASAFDASK
ncbi:MAG: YraN family protein [Oscillospiraceae bacterium]